MKISNETIHASDEKYYILNSIPDKCGSKIPLKFKGNMFSHKCHDIIFKDIIKILYAFQFDLNLYNDF